MQPNKSTKRQARSIMSTSHDDRTSSKRKRICTLILHEELRAQSQGRKTRSLNNSKRKKNNHSKEKKKKEVNNPEPSPFHSPLQKIEQSGKQRKKVPLNLGESLNSSPPGYNPLHYQSMKRANKKGKKKFHIEKQIHNLLMQDVKLKLHESTQIAEWEQLLQELKLNKPEKSQQIQVLNRQLHKILELRENIELNRYKIFTKMIDS